MSRRQIAVCVGALFSVVIVAASTQAQYSYTDSRTGPPVTIVPENGRVDQWQAAPPAPSSRRSEPSYDLDRDPRYRTSSPSPRLRSVTNGSNFRTMPLTRDDEREAPRSAPASSRPQTRSTNESYRTASASRSGVVRPGESPRLAQRPGEPESLPAPEPPKPQPHSVTPNRAPVEDIGPIPEENWESAGEYVADGDCEYDECNDDCDYDPLAILRLLAAWSRNMTINAGVQGFKGPFDAGRLGNFGFHEGVNWGVPLLPWWGVGGQIGFQFEHSDFDDGSDITSNRRQFFFTTGLFHRAGPCGGLQWGVVYDYMRDDYYVLNDLTQIRAEISLVGARCHEIGFTGAFGASNFQYTSPFSQRTLVAEPLDMYAFFYRHRFCEGGNLRLLGGFTGEQDGIVGGDFHVPVSRYLALESAFNYVIPNHVSTEGSRESWNVGIQLVVYPTGRAYCGDRSIYRPVFNVADNGSFVTDLKSENR